MTTVSFNSDTSKQWSQKQGTIAGRRPSSDTHWYRHPWENRKALSEDYEPPVSGREGWWRTYIRETPRPGNYEFSGFLEDINQRPNTYRFKSDGRKIDPHPHGKGAFLLPGAYESQDFLQRLDKTPTPATYSFKTARRDAFDVLNFGKKDKEINVSPTAYPVENHLTLTTDKASSKHAGFKSKSQRFPSLFFVPKEGPAPGIYDYNVPSVSHPVSSSFKSKTPRFFTSHTKVPGPGSYDKTLQYPMPETIEKMGRQYGLFFTSGFEA